MEQTYVMIKPDGVQRNLIGEIISRIENKGFKVAAMKMIKLSRETAGVHYGEHKGKPFFNGLVDFITSGPVVAMVVEGENVVSAMRKIIGSTNPLEADCGTIRGDYGLSVGKNIIHGSDSLESAKREIGIYFTNQEICEYHKNIEDWIYEG
ncbi:MAG: nucleoside-diphosphate kinase [Desulfitibacter sp. BRH_c19]|nr:MAG: nucleoside-diphosphate kinase [Desulfitibacter sp. BRH_c19]